MKLKERIKRLLSRFGFEEFAGFLYGQALRIIRTLKGADGKIIRDYFDGNQIRRLHIGCGGNILEGWLNSDYLPNSKEVIHLDATKPYPFDNNEFDCIFSEHMIEHVLFSQGHQMLAECFRVLKPNGKLRISTPDLSFLIDLYGSDKSELQKEFIKDSTDKWIDYAPYYEDTFVINNYVRAWGHKFIYDEKVLTYLLEKAGFVNVTRFDVGESRDEELQDLENVARKSAGLIALESLVLEATKP